jgi:hypothetical protein
MTKEQKVLVSAINEIHQIQFYFARPYIRSLPSKLCNKLKINLILEGVGCEMF